MKQFSTWLTDDLAARYKKHLRRVGMKPYTHIRQLISIELGVEKAHVVKTQIIWGFLIYGLIASTLILLRFPLVIIPSGLWLTTGEPWDYATGKYVPLNPYLALLAVGVAVGLVFFKYVIIEHWRWGGNP